MPADKQKTDKKAESPSGKDTRKKNTKPVPDRQDDSPDFGGIPSRDLKKNLGCGG